MAYFKSSFCELTQQHHIYYKTLLHQQLHLVNKINVGSICKNQKKSFRWYCQLCGLMLSSTVQAQEHFFGKKHQNMLKRKDAFNQDNGPKIVGQNTADKKHLLAFEGLHGPSGSSFDQGLRSGNEISHSDVLMPPPAARDNILESVVKSERKTFYSSDLSIYRTPSGNYYCQPCNVTVKSQTMFLQHSESRKHKQKAARTSVKGK